MKSDETKWKNSSFVDWDSALTVTNNQIFKGSEILNKHEKSNPETKIQDIPENP